MNRNQVIDLLSVIVSYDNRAADEASIASFLDAAKLGKWTYGEAERAARDWLNAHPDEWLRPGHITQLIRARRRDALEHAAVPSQTPDPMLLRKLEAFGDAKSVDTLDGRRDVPQLPRAPRSLTRGERAVEEAMRRGEQARSAAKPDDAATEESA